MLAMLASGCAGHTATSPGPSTAASTAVCELVQKACRTYDKGARCFAKAASVSDAAGATIAGTPQARTQRRSLSCAFAAQGNGSNVLGEAEAKAAAIKAQFS